MSEMRLLMSMNDGGMVMGTTPLVQFRGRMQSVLGVVYAPSGDPISLLIATSEASDVALAEIEDMCGLELPPMPEMPGDGLPTWKTAPR